MCISCIVLNSLPLLLLIICTCWPRCSSSVYHLCSLPPRLSLPPQAVKLLWKTVCTPARRSFTQQVQRRLRKVLQTPINPSSIQIALALAAIAIASALITITATQKLLCIRLGALLFLHNKASATVTVTSQSPPRTPALQVSCRGYLCCCVV